MRKLKLFLDAKAANTPPRGISKASRVIFSVLTLLFLSIGQMWGAETVYKTATFAAANCTSNSSYTGSVTCTISTDSWTAAYAANNNGKWDYIKMGGKRPSGGGTTVHTGTIVTSASYSEAITKVVVNGTLERGSVSAKLIYASNAAFTSDKVESNALTSFTDGKMTFTIASPVAGRYYKLEFVCTNGTTTNGVVNISSVEYYKETGGTPTCATPTFSPAAGAVLSGTEVTISCATAGATIHYTTDGTTPTTSSPTYSGAITVSSAMTIQALAEKSGMSNSSVASASYTIATPLTTMDQIFSAATTAGNTATDVYVTFNNWVVTGVKNSNAYVTDGTKGFIIYASGHGFVVGNVLSGTAACKVQLYNGSAELTNLTSSTTGLSVTTGGTAPVNVLNAAGIEALGGVNTGSLIKISGECSQGNSKYYIGGVQLYNSLYSFSVSAGTSYDCTGVYVQYNSTKEILPRSAADIVVSSSVEVTGVDLTESTAEVEVGETVTLHASVEPGTATDKAIVWSVVSGSDKASVANGVVTGIAAGEAVIRAASHEDESIYQQCTVTVTAADPTKHVVTFDATVDKTTENTELSITKGDLTIAVTAGDGRFNNGTDYRPYKNAVFTVSCSNGNITKIEFTCTSSKPITGFADLEGLDKANEVWTGNAASVSFTASGAQVQMTQLVITYKEDARPEAGLAWDPSDDIELTVGDAFTAPTLSNPNSIAAAEITIESSNTDVATVTAGAVSLVNNATGTTTITATFAGNASYKPATVSYDITVNAAALTDYYEKVTETAGIVEGTYLIVYEDGDNSLAFNGGLATLDAEGNNTAVTITNDNKIGVTTETAAATFYIDPTAGTVKSASDHYIGVSSWGNGLKQTDTYIHNVFEIDGDGNAQVGIYNADWNTTGGTMLLQYNKSAGQTRFRYYKNGGQQSIALYKLHGEVVKPEAGLAWDPSDDIELTVGDAFTAPTLLNPNSIDAAEITIESSNTDVATVTAGAVSLVNNATGTTTITATFAGNASYKPATVSYKIKVNPTHSIYVDKQNVNFNSVTKDATVDDQTVAVTLTNVAAVTATLGGSGASAFSIDPEALTATGNITISASSATVGTFNATLTISDDASEAESKVVSLKIIVTDPAAEEAPISTSTKWVVATAADLVDGAEVIITGVKDEVVYAMGEQKSTNRAAYVASVDGDGVLTPGEGTMSFTLVAQEAEGVFALRTSDGKYLYAAASGSNHMKTQDEVDVNAKWTLSVTSAVATGSSNRNVMQFNGSGTNKLFSCYSSASQAAIQFYVPKPATPPAPTSEDVRTGLQINRYYTICLGKDVTAATGATFWNLKNRNSAETEVYLEEVQLPLVAGKPYIFQATATTLNVTYGDETQATPINNGALRGTFEDLNATQLAAKAANVYILIQNSIRPAGGENSLKANRAYIDYDALTIGQPASAPGKRVRAIPMQPQVTTGMDELNASEKPVKLMIDGQLFILRGDKLYDATGRLVK